jgi:nucleotide-binding universal stress UspA family protein
MKNILVLIHDDPGQEARLQAALDVTRAVNGHLICLDVATIMPFVGDATGISGGAMLLEVERESETANRARIEPRVAAEGVAWQWIDTTDYVAPALESAAGLADLIVVNTALETLPLPDMRAIAASLVANARKPVLAVPQDAKGFAIGAALVAWDGSREAADALAAAVPLLGLADRVTIVEVDDGSIGAPAEEAAVYLSRHGIEPRIDRETGSAAADILLARAASGAFDYIVMGGFGHSRMVEAVFGGVTRRLLEESPIPLLITH